MKAYSVTYVTIGFIADLMILHGMEVSSSLVPAVI